LIPPTVALYISLSLVTVQGTTDKWKNHGEYVSSIAKTVNSFVDKGLLKKREKGRIISHAAQSTCGKKLKLKHKDRH